MDTSVSGGVLWWLVSGNVSGDMSLLLVSERGSACLRTHVAVVSV